jgi:hypothetical protein
MFLFGVLSRPRPERSFRHTWERVARGRISLVNLLGSRLSSLGRHALRHDSLLHLIGDSEGNAPTLFYDLTTNDSLFSPPRFYPRYRPCPPRGTLEHNTRRPLLPFQIHKFHGIEFPPDSVLHAHVGALRILHIDVPISAKRQFQLFCSEHFPGLALTSAAIRQRATHLRT